MNLRFKRYKELCTYLVKEIKQNGFADTFKRGAAFVKRRTGKKMGRFIPANSALQRQKNVDANDFALVSICVPLYNTPQNYFKDMLNSVLGQTVSKWELCFADASDDTRLYDEICAINDNRIKCIKIENAGIAENTNKVIETASGDYIALLDHDDILSPNAIYEICVAAKSGRKFIYSDEALFTNDYTRPIVGHFKPDFAPDYLNCCNYICHFTAFTKKLFYKAGAFNKKYDGSQDHDLFLKISEICVPYHIPKVLYYWRISEQSTSRGVQAKPYVAVAAKAAIAAHLERTGAKGIVKDGLFESTYKIDYAIDANPLVSIMIPNKDHIDDLKKAIKSIINKTQYKNYEIIIIENNSQNPATFQYYNQLPSQCKVINYSGKFNFSAINNFGRSSAKGEYLLLLNNDVEIINGEWLYEMLSLCTQSGVGVVGAKLYYEDDTVQHAGVIVGLGGFAGHSHKYAKKESGGYMFRLGTVQNFSAVTAACMLVKASVYDEVGGMDEEFTVAFNDVDFCLRVKQKGYRILYTPYAQLYHYESKSRGLDTKGEAKLRFEKECERMKAKYGKELLNDDFYSPNLTLDREDFTENDVLPRDV